jgi:dCTP diphosphatase
MSDSLEDLRCQAAAFTTERDWDQFHSPKNLSMALIAEAAELVEHFQWLTQAQSRDLPGDKKEAVGQELADILIYLVRLADTLDIDLIHAAHAKMKLNALRYPAAKVRGSAKRAAELNDS